MIQLHNNTMHYTFVVGNFIATLFITVWTCGQTVIIGLSQG